MNNFEILNIPKGSNKETIKKAYRKLAIEYHPDKNNGDTKKAARFIVIKQAYEELLSGNAGEPITHTSSFRQGRRNPWDNFQRDFFESGSVKVESGKIINGDFELRVKISHIAKIQGYDGLKHLSWSPYEATTGIYRLNIKKSDLKKTNYDVNLRFEDFKGDVIQKQFKIKRPKLTFGEKVANLIGLWYGLKI